LRLQRSCSLKRSSLGKGLSALIPDIDKEGLTSVQIDKITPNPFQPRHKFDSDKLKELSRTIKKEGILEPVLLRKTENGYQIIAGERRIRAAKLAKISVVPAIIKQGITDLQMAKLALIENLQREELTCVEQAEGYRKLMEEFGYTQREVAQIAGAKRATIANLLRILNLPSEVIDLLQKRLLSLGHAKLLLSIEDAKRQIELAKMTVKEQLSVRALEKQIEKNSSKVKKAAYNYKNYEKKLSGLLDLPVRISGNRIMIRFAGNDELEKLIKRLSEYLKADRELHN